MCARRPTSAMPRSFLCCERAFCRSMVVMFCALKWSVLMSWCLLRGQVMWWSRHAMKWLVLCHVTWCNAMSWWWAVLLKYYPVLQSTTQVLPCSTKCYSSTTLYYSSTTPILPWTTKYYSSTTLYYKVLLQYYPVLQSTTTQVLQSTTPVLPCTTKYSSVLQSTTPVLPCTTKYFMIDPLPCAEQQASPCNLTKYCASHALCIACLIRFSKYCGCQAKWISWLIRIAYETSFTMRRATGITLQLHQILRLPRKMNLMIDPHHRWNVIYNARSNRQHPPTSPNTAPATHNECHDWATSQMKRHLQCAEQQATPSNLTKYCACHAKWISWLIRITDETSFTMRIATGNTLQPHQILRLPRKMTTQDQTENSWKQVKCHFQCATDPRMIRDRSDHDPTQKTQTATRRAAEATFRTRQEQILLKITTFPAPAIIPNFTKCCTCHKKWHMNFTKCCTCHKKWHVNFTKCCTCHKKWHMNFTKCCTCHQKWQMNFTKCCTCHKK